MPLEHDERLLFISHLSVLARFLPGVASFSCSFKQGQIHEIPCSMEWSFVVFIVFIAKLKT
jgi:hypothetical protein